MSRTHILLIFLLLPLTLRSQEDICIGKELVLYSTVLQEDRSYWIHLPEHYNMDTKQRYPVVYLLDGDSFFHSLVGIRKTLASGRGKYLPPCIIVGVLNTDRTRDFTPTASAAGRDGKISIDAIPQGGGSEAFSKFLTEELRPAIDSAYRTNGWNMLIGHSYAGLFTLNTFLRHTELFDTYLAVDPSLWWDQGRLVREAEALVAGRDFKGKSLYIGVASKKRTDRVDIHLDKVSYLLSELLPQAENLRFFSKSFPDENHGTVAVPGIYDGIKTIIRKMRKFFAKVHLWLSIPFGIIIAIVCLTGAILVFETEILELGYPSRYFVKEVKGEPLSPATLIESARQQLPDSVRINGIRVSSDPRRTYQLILPGKKAAGFIDPYTGEVTGMDDGQGFFLKMMRLHRWLLDEYKRDGSFSWGKSIVGYATLVLAIIIISGIVIWYPRNKKVLRNRLKVKTKAGWFRFFYDLHVSGGFYAALLLLILALTGLTWSFWLVSKCLL